MRQPANTVTSLPQKLQAYVMNFLKGSDLTQIPATMPEFHMDIFRDRDVFHFDSVWCT